MKIDRAFHALTCISPFYGYFSRSCVIGAMRLFSVPHGSESILLGYGAVMMLGGRQSGETFRSALWADFECRYAYRYIQISVPSDRLWKTPSTYLPTFWRFRAWFSEKFTVCSWWFSLLHSFNTGFLLMMTVISEGGFLGNGIAFSGMIWYNGEVE